MSLVQDGLALGDHTGGSVEVDIGGSEEPDARVVVIVVVPVEDRAEVLDDEVQATEAIWEIRHVLRVPPARLRRW